MLVRLLTLFCVVALNFEISSCKAKKAGESKSDGDLTLKNIFVTFRSQEHTASDYPKGPNITDIPETDSTLTQDGKDHAYNFGKYLRENYTSLLSGKSTLDESDFYCKGTNTRRTQESAMFVAAALVGNKSEETTWTKEKGEEYKFNKTAQYIKFYNRTYCPEFYKAVAKQVNTTTFNESVKSYLETVKKVIAQYPTVTQRNPATIWLAYETFWSQKAENKTVEWTDQEMEDLRKYAERFIYTAESSNESKKLSGGVMVDGLLKKFEGETNEPKMRPMSLLAAPQAVLGGMIGAFSPNGTKYNGSDFTPENFYPGNGSYHILEYYEKGGNNDKHFRVLYTPNWTVPLMPLIYDGCNETDGMCTQEKLKQALEGIRLPEADQNKTCDPGTGQQTSTSPK